MGHFLIKNSPPASEEELYERCRSIEGMSFGQLAKYLNVAIPQEASKRKGWTGMMLEMVLGTDAGNHSLPDFQQLGIELKTLPLSLAGTPAESTFVTSIPLLTIHLQKWESSQCFGKLRRVLWVPVEGDRRINYAHRRIGKAVIWSPSIEQEKILAADWEFLSFQISTGQLDTLNSAAGDYLQVRPKGINGKSLCYAFDSQGNKIQTLPRGFYLRTCFTKQIDFNV